MDGLELREGIYLVVRDPGDWCQCGVLFGDPMNGWYLLTSDLVGLKFERFTATGLRRDFVQASAEQATAIRDNLISTRQCPGAANCPVTCRHVLPTAPALA